MRNTLFAVAAFCTLVAGFSTPSFAGYAEDLINFVKGKGAPAICRKASLFDFTFSIRSGEGKACTLPIVAAFAELVCANQKNDPFGYMTSGCHTKAIVALGDKIDNKEKLAELINAEIGNYGGQAKPIVCNAIKSVLGTDNIVVATICQ